MCAACEQKKQGEGRRHCCKSDEAKEANLQLLPLRNLRGVRLLHVVAAFKLNAWKFRNRALWIFCLILRHRPLNVFCALAVDK